MTDSLCGEIRDTEIIPHFKQRAYPAGIIAGTERLAAILKAHPDAVRGVPGSAPLLVRTPRRDALGADVGVGVAAVITLLLGLVVAARRLYSTIAFALVTVVGLAAVVVAAYLTWRAPAAPEHLALFGATGVGWLATWFYNLQKYRRFGPHGCSKCGTQLELLSEQADDAKLSSVRRLEERLGSVDYDVWICPACLNNETDSYIKPFSGFTVCPKCQARTFKEGPQTVIRAASTIAAGKARIDGRCVSCKYKSVRYVVLPIIVVQPTSNVFNSSSSSFGSSFGGGGGGSSFGGGSSGGGGASGGW